MGLSGVAGQHTGNFRSNPSGFPQATLTPTAVRRLMLAFNASF